jgi:hypothetical protein
MRSCDHHGFRHRLGHAIFHRRRDCDARPLTIQTAFAQEVVALQKTFPWLTSPKAPSLALDQFYLPIFT